MCTASQVWEQDYGHEGPVWCDFLCGQSEWLTATLSVANHQGRWYSDARGEAERCLVHQHGAWGAAVARRCLETWKSIGRQKGAALRLTWGPGAVWVFLEWERRAQPQGPLAQEAGAAEDSQMPPELLKGVMKRCSQWFRKSPPEEWVFAICWGGKWWGEERRGWKLPVLHRIQCCRGKVQARNSKRQRRENKAKEWVEVFIQVSRRHQSGRAAPQPQDCARRTGSDLQGSLCS